ncbi:MAG: PKD domain-containing protein [Bacteroidales bacterium]|nr:PKD domain-containing protein [Bacteroidales bacterium]
MKKVIIILLALICYISADYAYAQQPVRRICTDEELVFNVTHNDVICDGTESTAMVNIEHSNHGNTNVFWFEWSTGEISQVIPIYNSGQYSVTVTDTYNACSKTENFEVLQAPAVNVSITKTDVTCYGQNDGIMIAIVNGGTEPYSYSWSTTLHSDTITNLIPGTYSVTVTDNNDCTARATASIVEPTRFLYSISPAQGICRGSETTITATATGGTEPYTYEWDDGTTGIGNRIVSPDSTSAYTVSITDANGCTNAPQTTRVIVSQPIEMNPEIHNILCHGECNGSAVLNIHGGIPPFTYTWDSNTDYIENLCAGSYAMTITDLYNCTASTSFVITEPDTIYVATISGPASCFGYNDGFVQVNATGGVHFTNGRDDYHYLWDDGQTTVHANMGAGYHTVTVSDANGCTHTGTAFVDQPQAIYVTDPTPNGGTICIGETLHVYANATGGEGPYEFVWRGPDDFIWYGHNFSASPTTTSTYTLDVTDIHGCTAARKQMTINVNSPIEILSVTQENDEICKGDKIVFDVEIAGGNGGPYRITSDEYGIITTPCSIYAPATGFYSFTVSDACGSPTARDSVYALVHPLPDVGFYSDKSASCPPGTFQFYEISDESANQTYLWDFGNERTSSVKNPRQTFDETGSYNVSLTVTSDFGCSNTKTKNNMIVIYEEPRAEFVIDPDLTSILTTEIKFINYSEGGTTYLWNFGDGNTSIWSNETQIHTYEKAGDYTAMLVAKNKYQCVDTAYKKLSITNVYTFYAPTAFTPNGDGDNDFFYISGNGIDDNNFELTVYNRYGERMFKTTTFDMESPQSMAWDGTNDGSILKGDKIATTGPYNWVCKFLDFTGKPHEKKGTVFLLK